MLPPCALWACWCPSPSWPLSAAFPNENIAAVQMTIGIIPLMMALSAMLVFTARLSRVRRKTTLVGHVIVMLAGASVLVFPTHSARS